MLAVMIKIGSIDYEETMKAIFPWIIGQLEQQETDHWPVRLIRSLGDDAGTVALGVFSRLSIEDREELLVHCVNGYGQALTRKANEALNRKYGPSFRIGGIFLERDAGFYLQLRRVCVAYDSLPEQLLSPRMNALLRMLIAASGGIGASSIEAPLLEFVRQKENKRRLIKELQGLLLRYGLIVHVDDLDVAQDPAETLLPFSNDAGLNENLKAALCEALASYMRDLL